MKRAWSVRCSGVTLALGAGLWSSQALAADPTTADCLGASEASFKSGNDHKLRMERTQLLICAAPSCPADVRKECVHRVDEVNAAVPTIIFQAKDGSGADLTAVKVTMDSEVLAERLEGTALSIDPGEHTFTFEAAGYPAVTRKLVIQEAQKERRETVNFGTTPGTTNDPGRPLGTQKLIGVTLAGVGVIGVAVGSVFGILTASASSAQKSDCASPTQCTDYSGAASHHSSGVTDGTISTVSFVAGGAFLAAGAVLFFTAKRHGAQPVDAALVVAPSVAPGAGGLLMKGAF